MVKAGGLPYRIGQDIDRVGGDQEDAVEVISDDICDDAVHDLDVLIHQVKAGFAGLLGGAGADDDHVSVRTIFVGALGDAGTLWRPDHTVVEVHDIAFQLPLIDVDDGQVVDDALVDQCVGVSDSHVTRANENDFISYMLCHDPIVQRPAGFCMRNVSHCTTRYVLG